jgi:cysteine desulfurase
MEQLLYFDNNATTQVDQRVLEAIMPFLTFQFGNANSTHHFGIIANEAVKKSRAQVADLIGAEANEIVFTSGATEAINLGIKGIAESYSCKGKHIVTVSTEHPAVLDTCKNLESKGFEVTYLPVNTDGLVDLSLVERVLREDTILVAVMLANNETGVIQPIKTIVKLTHSVGALFMSDATQAVGKMTVNVEDLGVDLLCLSGHKFYAPKGIGALYLRGRNKRVQISSLLHGGGQENGIRSGTLNVPGIVGLGKASEIAKMEMKKDSEKISLLRNRLERELLKLPNVFINGSVQKRLYNVSNICFPGIDANVLIGKMYNVAVSNGSACSTASIKPSHVLKAIGLSDDDALASIRFSFGKFNTEEEVTKALEILKYLIKV